MIMITYSMINDNQRDIMMNIMMSHLPTYSTANDELDFEEQRT